MKKALDIYGYTKIAESVLRRLKDSDISERNKEIILKFRDYCVLEDLGMPRIVRNMESLKGMAAILKIDYDKATKEDIARLVTTIQEKEDSPWSKATHKKILKRFYKWLKNTGDEYPEEVKWIKAGIKKSDKKLLSNGDLITENEVKRLIDVAEHPRDKAFISVLYETGARIGEIGSLQICNVKFDNYGVILNVDGKTGCRSVRIISSTPYLTTWMQSHPLKEDKSAALWVNIGTTKHNSPLRYANMRALLKRLFDKAGIKKRCNPHLFRHSRATFLADHLTEFQMNQYLGWIQGSDMPSTYVHMSGKKIDNSILEMNGISVAKTSKESNLKPIICPRCDTINSHDSKFCNKCAGILDLKTAYELEKKVDAEQKIRTHSDNIMNLLMKDPEFMQIFVNKIKGMGL